jgi:hypothetical protein
MTLHLVEAQVSSLVMTLWLCSTRSSYCMMTLHLIEGQSAFVGNDSMITQHQEQYLNDDNTSSCWGPSAFIGSNSMITWHQEQLLYDDVPSRWGPSALSLVMTLQFTVHLGVEKWSIDWTMDCDKSNNESIVLNWKRLKVRHSCDLWVRKSFFQVFHSDTHSNACKIGSTARNPLIEQPIGV